MREVRLSHRGRYVRVAERIANRRRVIEALANEYSEEYKPPQTEVWSGCVRSSSNQSAEEALLTRVGMKLLREQKADYVMVRNVKKAPSDVLPICGMPRFTERKAEQERRKLDNALKLVRKCKTKPCKERRMAKVNELFADSPAKFGKQRCYCGEVVLTRFDLAKEAIRVKRMKSRARTVPLKRPYPGGANYWLQE